MKNTQCKELNTNENIDALTIEIINSETALEKIEDEWNSLISESQNASIFSTFQVVRIVWKHFHSSNDELFILVLKRDEKIVGIAPFRIKIKKVMLFPIRVICFISEWGDGDKPCIAAVESEKLVWHRIFQFLHKEYKKWDFIVLPEQPTDSLFFHYDFFGKNRYHSTFESDAVSYHASFKGNWEDYLKNRKRKIRQTWNKCNRILQELPDGIKVCCFEEPGDVEGALERFISIEQSGWKRDQNFSVGGNERQKAFYRELIADLAHRNMTSIYMLTSGAQDIAGFIVYKLKKNLYAAHTAYRDEFSSCSPGVILKAEVIRLHLGTSYKEIDFFALRETEEKQKHKSAWATDKIKTIEITIYKISHRLFLYFAGNILKKMLKNLALISKEKTPSIFF